ncbi:MAG: DNA repair protein RecN [Cryobacterium sp.]|nr:DNA repair protein RecN [Cryobacterium sp.]
MIEELSIRNLGVIGEANLPFGPGFTVLTGETGAGKTMIVTALGLLLGERADSGSLRKGGDAAVVEGHWIIDSEGPVAERVADAGGDLDAAGNGRAALVLSRSVSAEGRSRATVGGRSTPVGVLSELGAELVVVHGQSDQVRLRSATAQREALDRFAGAELASVLDEYQQTYRRWQAGQNELDLLVTESDRRTREAGELRLAIDELEQVAPQRGEDVELAERATRIGNLESLRLAAAGALELVSAQSTDDGYNVLGLLENARRQLERVASHDSALPPIVDAIANVLYNASDVSSQLSSYLGSLDADGANELEAIEERRAVLGALIRKHGPTLDETIDFLDVGSARLLELDNDTTRVEELRAQAAVDRERVIALGETLSSIRSSAAETLSTLVTSELSDLAMPDATIVVRVESDGDHGLFGKDQVSFLLRPHPGSEPRPLSRGASGGELSRVMLAIEVVVAANDPVPSFIFDEVDAGVGGASAIEIGKRLARLAISAQVIVVTHLPQVAAFASNHLRVKKSSDGEFTASSVNRLEGEERAEELARMLSGLADSESGLAHARELLTTAQDFADSLVE